MQSLLERIEQLESRARVEVEAQPAAEADGEQPAEEPQPAEKSQPEVVMKAAGEVSAEEIEEIPSPPLILSSVIVWMVQNANTRAGVLRASAWLICGLIFALAEITSLLSVGVSLQWKPCFAQEDCRLGQVCISFYEGVYRRSTCEDCYFVAKDETVAAPADWLYPDVISPEDRLGFGMGFGDDEATTGAARQGKGRGGSVLAVASANSTVSASEFCLRQLRGKAIALFEPDESIYFGGSEEPAEFEPHFRECHYVKEALQTMSRLDKTIVLLVLLLVAFGVAEDYTEQLHVRRVRQVSLPLTWRPSARTLGATLRWLAILVIIATEFLMSLVEPLVPFGIIMLLITQGTDSASALLNGLAMGFVLQIDDLVPAILLAPRDAETITAWLTQVAQEAYPKKHSRGIYGFHRTAACRSAVVVTTSFLIQTIVFFEKLPTLICEMLLHHLHYRATILLGVWVVGSINFGVESIGRISIFVYGGQISHLKHRAVFGSTKLWYVGREVLVGLEHFSYMLLAAFTLNVLYWYIVNILYYESTLSYSLEHYFEGFVLDLFGACGKGYYFNECLSQGPPGWDGAYAP